MVRLQPAPTWRQSLVIKNRFWLSVKGKRIWVASSELSPKTYSHLGPRTEKSPTFLHFRQMPACLIQLLYLLVVPLIKANSIHTIRLFGSRTGDKDRLGRSWMPSSTLPNPFTIEA